jgi:hypothetical protein
LPYQPINLSTYQPIKTISSLQRDILKPVEIVFTMVEMARLTEKNTSMKRIENGKARLVCPALGQSL